MKGKKFLCSNQKLFLFATMRPDAGFKIYGLLTVGYPLITSMVWQVASYLVILVQMRSISSIDMSASYNT
ncbi:hypothetical protein GE061_003829 [Apolygus lucorum]|uniref:Uncharacterized protein n=1 Tax=Apolygus lucorum TaxID=248454 RepID=A0A6A4JV18_APOLU|nr:hypothetical protein GE061_003829 [Apolygus lucorum]